MLAVQGLFAAVPDPRAANARHRLDEVLLVALAATLCGAQTCVDIATFARAKLPLLRRFVRLAHGAPSHDTFSRLFQALDPLAFEAAFRAFMAAFAKALDQAAQDQAAQDEPDGTGRPRIVALDGKSLRGAIQSAGRSTPLHLVTAWAAEQRLVLAQRHARNRSEVTAAREVIALLDLRDAVVTPDALHGNRATAAAILERGGAYALILKGNRGPLHAAAQALLGEADAETAVRTSHTAHGRYEERRAWVRAVPGWAERYGFAGLCAIARVDGLRRSTHVDAPAEAEPPQTRYVALSQRLDPAEVLRVVRAHWSIENHQHWLLDVAFREDAILTRNAVTAQNLALLRRLALGLIRQDATKGSLHTKRQLAGWNDDYLADLISQMR
ncbi:ISAs1 family transposase [Methylobacterium sp. NEAU 140]|uniref:ISAs1 family transposase n=1 Tax=Methylobacterium sp. NEAU 140 TaxID=3064945 RepID=UPI002734B4E8|nr:ISAs1 family transposase [Methylobacterium sp. NEAU 140]MDP4022948.1 ISAs1 family transposase [Methylobacterium sp. NEAU 140]MDP4023094.1 ISAs1 family transposase [Methylobacterium sp. NEAU 140]MDP4024486.1 ISAs1 family transposase [Methylobacterium sp. NEAU 140]MDP4026633.1 ISAs1 family transposase [Methylobacterium sp. NEAU 140]MDP4026988.1 ISAs1 family transposase [Methylobacterium sp. NEAU 140]